MSLVDLAFESVFEQTPDLIFNSAIVSCVTWSIAFKLEDLIEMKDLLN